MKGFRLSNTQEFKCGLRSPLEPIEELFQALIMLTRNMKYLAIYSHTLDYHKIQEKIDTLFHVYIALPTAVAQYIPGVERG